MRERKGDILKRTKYLEDGRTLYEHICDRENILGAIQDASKDHHRDLQVQMMKENPEEYADAIEGILKTKSFHYSRFRTCDIVERGKKRHLCFTITFPDRVVQHAVMRIVAPILLGSCVKFTYAAQKGRGTHACSMEVRRFIRDDPEGTRFYLKMDVRHYFQNVSRDILWVQVKKKIKCPDTLELMHRLIYEVPGRKGLAIGLYISQILSSFFLSPLDHWIVEVKRMKMLRYMDDIIVFSDSKIKLHRLRKQIQYKLKTEFDLKLKDNYRVAPISTGLDFVGFVHYPDYTRLRKSVKISYKRVANCIIKRLKKRIPIDKHIMGALNSYAGMAGWCDSKNLYKNTYDRVMRAVEFGIEALRWSHQAKIFELRTCSTDDCI